MNHNGQAGLPKGASFGHDPNRRTPKLLDYAEIAEYGNRAQRRYAKRLILRSVKKKDPK